MLPGLPTHYFLSALESWWPCSPGLGRPNTAKITCALRPDLRPSPYDGHLFNGGGRPVDLGRPAPTLLASMGGNKTPWVDVFNIVPDYHARLMSGEPPRSGEVEGARRLTIAETALLQTFDKGMEFCGRPSSQYRQIGNGVPPLLAKKLGRALLTQL
jgi:DNA (cytosine-5)-methyltransferase 1